MISQICKWIVFKCVYPAFYYLGSVRKVDSKKIIFVENHGTYLSDNYELLYNALKKQGYTLQVHYLKVSTSSWGKIILRTLKMLSDMSTAKCVFLNESNSVFGAFTLRKETKLVQLWHACGAFKKWGYSVADKSFGDNQQNLERYSGHKNYDLVSVSGEAVCWAYEEAFGLQNKPGVVRAFGVSRTDIYFMEEERQKAHKGLEELAPLIKNRKIILYAPTFRGDIRNAKSPGQLDLQVLSRLKDQYIVFVKQHPFVKESFLIPEEYRDFCIDIDTKMTIEELLMVSDICVTDYSSVIFEFSLMRKPMLFFAFDLNEYYDERGFYYPYKEFVPGPIVSTTTELVQRIEEIELYDYQQLDKFAETYMSGCDGHSTERILQYVMQ